MSGPARSSPSSERQARLWHRCLRAAQSACVRACVRAGQARRPWCLHGSAGVSSHTAPWSDLSETVTSPLGPGTLKPDLSSYPSCAAC